MLDAAFLSAFAASSSPFGGVACVLSAIAPFCASAVDSGPFAATPTFCPAPAGTGFSIAFGFPAVPNEQLGSTNDAMSNGLAKQLLGNTSKDDYYSTARTITKIGY